MDDTKVADEAGVCMSAIEGVWLIGGWSIILLGETGKSERTEIERSIHVSVSIKRSETSYAQS